MTALSCKDCTLISEEELVGNQEITDTFVPLEGVLNKTNTNENER